MTTRDFRKHIPVGVKLHAALLALGFSDEEIAGGIDWDHQPALALRAIDPDTGQMAPAPNDPHYLRPMRRADHRIKTIGRPATTAGSDIHAAAKVKRLAKKEADFKSRVLAIQKVPREGSKRWPSRSFPKRPKANQRPT